MTPEQAAAYITAQASCALIEAMGMQAENQIRAHRGESPAYNEDDFKAIIDRYPIHHNAAVNFLNS